MSYVYRIRETLKRCQLILNQISAHSRLDETRLELRIARAVNA